MRANFIVYFSLLTLASAQGANLPEDFDGIVNGALDLANEPSTLSKQNPSQLNNLARRAEDSPKSFSEMVKAYETTDAEDATALESPGNQRPTDSDDSGRVRNTPSRNRYNRYPNNSRYRPSRYTRPSRYNKGQRYRQGSPRKPYPSNEDCDEDGSKTYEKRWSGLGGKSPWVKDVEANMAKNRSKSKSQKRWTPIVSAQLERLRNKSKSASKPKPKGKSGLFGRNTLHPRFTFVVSKKVSTKKTVTVNGKKTTTQVTKVPEPDCYPLSDCGRKPGPNITRPTTKH